VLAVVVERIAARDTLDDEPRGFVQTGGKMRFLIAVDPAVGFGQVTPQCVSQEARWIQHIASSTLEIRVQLLA